MFETDGKNLVDTIVSRNIKKRRTELNFSEAMVGEYLGCSDQYISMLENGEVRPNAATLYKLALFLRCGLADFFMATNDKN